jgi:hypothetical protein
MKHLMWAAAVAAAWLGAGASAQAQGYVRPQTNPYNKPAFSPWLNLNRFGTNPAINYFGLVQPQLDTNTSLLQLQQQQQALYNTQQGLVPGTDPTLPTTGHPTRFMNYTRYFNNYGGQAANTPPAAPFGATINTGGGFGPRPRTGR